MASMNMASLLGRFHHHRRYVGATGFHGTTNTGTLMSAAGHEYHGINVTKYTPMVYGHYRILMHH